MRRSAASLFFLLALSSFSNLPAQEGRLAKVREEVRDGPDEPAAKEKVSNSCWSGYDNDDCESCLGSLMFLGLLAPFSVPHQVLDDDFANPLYFPGHPYPAGFPGYMRFEAPYGPDPAKPLFGMHWLGGRLSLENGNDFNGLNRANVQLLVETAARFGLQTSWNFFHERMRPGRSDQLLLGDANLVYRFAQSERALFRSGLGCRALIDRHEDHFGFNFTYGADFFPAKPVVVSGVLDLGNVGSAFVVHGRGTAGLIYRGWELFAGYDFYRVGSMNLQGPLLGLRLWF